MTEPALLDLVAPSDDPETLAALEALEVEIEVVEIGSEDALLDPWFLLSEAEIAQIEDDPTARIHEIRITGYGTGFEDSRWAF